MIPADASLVAAVNLTLFLTTSSSSTSFVLDLRSVVGLNFAVDYMIGKEEIFCSQFTGSLAIMCLHLSS